MPLTLQIFQIQRRRKNCNCSKVWKNHTKIRALDYDQALDIVVSMNRGNKNFNFKIKR